MGKRIHQAVSFHPLGVYQEKASVVRLNGKRYYTRFRFREVLSCMKLLEDKRLSYFGKMRAVFKLLLSPISYRRVLFLSPSEQKELFQRIFTLLSASETTTDPIGEGGRERLVCFFRDSGRIYSAFLSCYKMDLRKENPDWFLFLTLLASLPKNTRFYEVVAIRAMPVPVPNGTNAEEIRRLLLLKQRYALQDEKEYQSQLEVLFSRLEREGKRN